MSNIFVLYPFPCSYKSVDCEKSGIYGSYLHDIISTTIGLSEFSLYCNGKKVYAEHHVLPNSTVHLSLSLPGGKGGFGSMLRAIGAQIEKTTNREACRDLSGRRLRDINEEQRLKSWIAKKAEREAEKMRRRKERLERLKSRPKHNFVDFGYEKEISELPERIDEALSAGIEKSKKRPPELSEPSTSGNNKKKRLWLDEDSESDSDLSSSNSNEEVEHYKDDDLVSSTNAETSCSNSVSNDGDATSGPVSTESPGPSQETSLNSNEHVVEDEKEIQSDKNTLKSEDDAPVDLNKYESAKELEALGLERLKSALMSRGLKCGGSLGDRAERLWAVRGLSPDQYPKHLLAKQKKK